MEDIKFTTNLLLCIGCVFIVGELLGITLTMGEYNAPTLKVICMSVFTLFSGILVCTWLQELIKILKKILNE